MENLLTKKPAQSNSAWVEEALPWAGQVPESTWTESSAVGSSDYLETMKARLRIRAKERRISGTDGETSLGMFQASYGYGFKGLHTNEYLWVWILGPKEHVKW